MSFSKKIEKLNEKRTLNDLITFEDFTLEDKLLEDSTLKEYELHFEEDEFFQSQQFDSDSINGREHIHTIDTREIVLGREFKNYKDMCKILNIPEKTSVTKNKQLQQLQMFYFNYNKKGHKFIISKIHNLNEMQLRARTLKLSYRDYIEELILNLIVDEVKKRQQNILHCKSTDMKEQELYKEFIISRNKLATAISLVNKNYSMAVSHKGTYCRLAKINREAFEDWHRSVSKFVQRNIEGALLQLMDKNLIMCRVELSVATFELNDFARQEDRDNNGYMGFETSSRSYKHRLATPKEKSEILKLRESVLKDLKCKTMSEVYALGGTNKVETFNRKLQPLLAEMNIAFCYNSYVLNLSQSILENYNSVNNIDFALTSRAKKEYEKQMNNMVTERVNEMALRRMEKSFELQKIAKEQERREIEENMKYSEEEKVILRHCDIVRIDDSFEKSVTQSSKDLVDSSTKKNYNKIIVNSLIENKLLKEKENLEKQANQAI